MTLSGAGVPGGSIEDKPSDTGVVHFPTPTPRTEGERPLFPRSLYTTHTVPTPCVGRGNGGVKS